MIQQVFYAMLFFNEILTKKFVKKKKNNYYENGFQGTRSHDLNQQVFKCHETDPDLDFKSYRSC